MRRADRPTGRDLALLLACLLAFGATVVLVAKTLARILVALRLP